LLVTEPAFLEGGADEVQVSHDLGQGGVVDDLAALGAHGGPAGLAASPELGVLGTDNMTTH
jgi:hypothetical protein